MEKLIAIFTSKTAKIVAIALSVAIVLTVAFLMQSAPATGAKHPTIITQPPGAELQAPPTEEPLPTEAPPEITPEPPPPQSEEPPSEELPPQPDPSEPPAPPPTGTATKPPLPATFPKNIDGMLTPGPKPSATPAPTTKPPATAAPTTPPPKQPPAETEKPAATTAPPAKNASACVFSIRCDTILSNMSMLNKAKQSILPADGIIMPQTTIEIAENETAFDLLKRVTRENKIHMEFSITPIDNGAYIQGIGNIYEFDCGPLSGWTYRLNGTVMGYGSSLCIIKPGDVLEWLYTCDLGRDVGGPVVN